jgi:hypothetical protein
MLEPDAEGELMPLAPGELVPVPLPMDPDVPVPDPDVLGEADGAPLSEIPATCIAC